MSVFASSTYNSDNGILFIPSVSIDDTSETYVATLQSQNALPLPQVGQEFALQDLQTGVTTGIPNNIYHTVNNLVYLPDVLVTTVAGTSSYRMLLRFEGATQKLTVIAVAQNGAALYNLSNGELYLPVVDSARGILSMNVLLKRADAQTGMFKEGSEFIVMAVTHASPGDLTNVYDFNTQVGYFSEVLVNESDQTHSYQVRFVLVPHQVGEVARIRVLSVAL
ncbi:MAG: hypothetical protein R3E08_09955, partial [Thiotrichaceae bacterium]